MERGAPPLARTHLAPFFITATPLWGLCLFYSRPLYWYFLIYAAMGASVLRRFGWTRNDAPGWVLVFLGVPAWLLIILIGRVALNRYAA